jgi:hypothetical protein
MIMNLRNSKEQDDRKKETLGSWPQLTHVTPTALLGIGLLQQIEDMRPFETDFETNAY